MDKQTIQVVQASWSQVRPIAAVAGPLFYKNLFEADPALRQLFKGDMDAQATKLMQMIGVAVGTLNDLDTLVPILKQLGARHRTYGVEAEHYETVGAALLKTLEQGLGPAFTPETEQAWASVYRTMSGVMISAAQN